MALYWSWQQTALAHENIAKVQKWQKCQYDKRSSEHKLKVGSRVMVYFPNHVKGNTQRKGMEARITILWATQSDLTDPLLMLKCNCGTALTRGQFLRVTMRWLMSFGWDTVLVQRRVTTHVHVCHQNPVPTYDCHTCPMDIHGTSIVHPTLTDQGLSHCPF